MTGFGFGSTDLREITERMLDAADAVSEPTPPPDALLAENAALRAANERWQESLDWIRAVHEAAPPPNERVLRALMQATAALTTNPRFALDYRTKGVIKECESLVRDLQAAAPVPLTPPRDARRAAARAICLRCSSPDVEPCENCIYLAGAAIAAAHDTAISRAAALEGALRALIAALGHLPLTTNDAVLNEAVRDARALLAAAPQPDTGET